MYTVYIIYTYVYNLIVPEVPKSLEYQKTKNQEYQKTKNSIPRKQEFNTKNQEMQPRNQEILTQSSQCKPLKMLRCALMP